MLDLLDRVLNFELSIVELVCVAVANALADLLPRGPQHTIYFLLCGEVRPLLCFTQRGFELAHQIGGTHNLFAERLQHLDCSRVDH